MSERLPAIAQFALMFGLLPPLPPPGTRAPPRPRNFDANPEWWGLGPPVGQETFPPFGTQPEVSAKAVATSLTDAELAEAERRERNRRLDEQRRRQCGRRSKRARGRGR